MDVKPAYTVDELLIFHPAGRKYYRIESVRKWMEARESHPNPRRQR